MARLPIRFSQGVGDVQFLNAPGPESFGLAEAQAQADMGRAIAGAARDIGGAIEGIELQHDKTKASTAYNNSVSAGVEGLVAIEKANPDGGEPMVEATKQYLAGLKEQATEGMNGRQKRIFDEKFDGWAARQQGYHATQASDRAAAAAGREQGESLENLTNSTLTDDSFDHYHDTKKEGLQQLQDGLQQFPGELQKQQEQFKANLYANRQGKLMRTPDGRRQLKAELENGYHDDSTDPKQRIQALNEIDRVNKQVAAQNRRAAEANLEAGFDGLVSGKNVIPMDEQAIRDAYPDEPELAQQRIYRQRGAVAASISRPMALRTNPGELAAMEAQYSFENLLTDEEKANPEQHQESIKEKRPCVTTKFHR